MKAFTVLGANFGDEGKGLMTDYLASQQTNNSVVVRFNGGAQAGHTVHTLLNQRHVFKHIGSGSFCDSATFLSEFFICNPLLFRNEYEQLLNYQITPQIYVHPQALITTPYDMMINQIAEELREQNRHGSCGVGINETVERSAHPKFTLKMQDIYHREQLIHTLDAIQHQWVNSRLEELRINHLPEAWQERILSEDIKKHFLIELEFFMAKSVVAENQILKQFSAVIFEGAQGLLLDESKGFFPHVTRSATGLKNCLSIAKSIGLTKIEVFYMTRAYLTRHGSGPLPFELDQLPYQNIIDKTNIHNLYQGSMRYSWLNLDLMRQAIYSDLKDSQDELIIEPHLVVTCMDQLDIEAKLIINNQLITVSKAGLLHKLHQYFPDFRLWSCKGPTRTDLAPVFQGQKAAILDKEIS